MTCQVNTSCLLQVLERAAGLPGDEVEFLVNEVVNNKDGARGKRSGLG